MEVTIKKATVKGSLFLNYEFDQTEFGVKNSIKTSSDQPIHDDLRSAFKALIPHFAFICEEIRDEKLIKKAIESPEDYLLDKENAKDISFFKYRVYQFAIIDKKDGDEYVAISGSKQLESMDEISFTTPNTSLFDTDYKFLGNLNECIKKLKHEVQAYMQGKCAEKSQTEMDFGEDENPLEEAVENLKKTFKDHDVTMEIVTK